MMPPAGRTEHDLNAARRLRNAAGLSQPALAAACQRRGWDIERDTIAKIEGGGSGAPRQSGRADWREDDLDKTGSAGITDALSL